jgi:hypothetical protein
MRIASRASKTRLQLQRVDGSELTAQLLKSHLAYEAVAGCLSSFVANQQNPNEHNVLHNDYTGPLVAVQSKPHKTARTLFKPQIYWRMSVS